MDGLELRMPPGESSPQGHLVRFCVVRRSSVTARHVTDIELSSHGGQIEPGPRSECRGQHPSLTEPWLPADHGPRCARPSRQTRPRDLLEASNSDDGCVAHLDLQSSSTVEEQVGARTQNIHVDVEELSLLQRIRIPQGIRLGLRGKPATRSINKQLADHHPNGQCHQGLDLATVCPVNGFTACPAPLEYEA